jgi:hypothetical protein
MESSSIDNNNDESTIMLEQHQNYQPHHHHRRQPRSSSSSSAFHPYQRPQQQYPHPPQRNQIFSEFNISNSGHVRKCIGFARDCGAMLDTSILFPDSNMTVGRLSVAWNMYKKFHVPKHLCAKFLKHGNESSSSSSSSQNTILTPTTTAATIQSNALPARYNGGMSFIDSIAVQQQQQQQQILLPQPQQPPASAMVFSMHPLLNFSQDSAEEESGSGDSEEDGDEQDQDQDEEDSTNDEENDEVTSSSTPKTQESEETNEPLLTITEETSSSSLLHCDTNNDQILTLEISVDTCQSPSVVISSPETELPVEPALAQAAVHHADHVEEQEANDNVEKEPENHIVVEICNDDQHIQSLSEIAPTNSDNAECE